MKINKTYRLFSITVEMLSILSKDFKLSNTDIVELAIKNFFVEFYSFEEFKIFEKRFFKNL